MVVIKTVKDIFRNPHRVLAAILVLSIPYSIQWDTFRPECEIFMLPLHVAKCYDLPTSPGLLGVPLRP